VGFEETNHRIARTALDPETTRIILQTSAI